MSTLLTAATASAVLGLLLPARRRTWAGPACVTVLLAAAALILLTEALMLAGDFETPLITVTVATSMLLPAFWLARAAGVPPTACDDHDDDAGGGGPDDAPSDPGPGPTDDSLGWDAFDEARATWASREREPAGV